MSTDLGQLRFLREPNLNLLWARMGIYMHNQSEETTVNLIELGARVALYIIEKNINSPENLEFYGSYISARTLQLSIRKLLKKSHLMHAVQSLRTDPLRVIPEYLTPALRLIVQQNGPEKKVLRTLLKNAFPDLTPVLRKLKSNPTTPIRGVHWPLHPSAPIKIRPVVPRVTESPETVQELQTRFLQRLNAS